MIKSVIIFNFVFLCCSCSTKVRSDGEPEKINSIPDGAFWVGGPDGGNWYTIDSLNLSGDAAFIKVYNDNDGSLIVSKRFKLNCLSGRQMDIFNLKEQIQGFDGEKIYLKTKEGRRNCFLE